MTPTMIWSWHVIHTWQIWRKGGSASEVVIIFNLTDIHIQQIPACDFALVEQLAVYTKGERGVNFEVWLLSVHKASVAQDIKIKTTPCFGLMCNKELEFIALHTSEWNLAIDSRPVGRIYPKKVQQSVDFFKVQPRLSCYCIMRNNTRAVSVNALIAIS